MNRSVSLFQKRLEQRRAMWTPCQPPCPRTLPHQLTPDEVNAIRDMVTSQDYRDVPTTCLVHLPHGEWIAQHSNVCLLGQPGTGKTHLSIALGLAACREGVRTKFFTAASLVNQLKEAQKKFWPRSTAETPRQNRPADRGRTRLPLVQSLRSRTAVPGLRRPLRTPQLADHQQPFMQRLGSDLPGRTNDRGPAGSTHSPLPHLRDEWRKLPLQRVDERKEEAGQTSLSDSPTSANSRPRLPAWSNTH
jgi:hypothetical protein